MTFDVPLAVSGRADRFCGSQPPDAVSRRREIPAAGLALLPRRRYPSTTQKTAFGSATRFARIARNDGSHPHKAQPASEQAQVTCKSSTHCRVAHHYLFPEPGAGLGDGIQPERQAGQISHRAKRPCLTGRGFRNEVLLMIRRDLSSTRFPRREQGWANTQSPPHTLCRPQAKTTKGKALIPVQMAKMVIVVSIRHRHADACNYMNAIAQWMGFVTVVTLL